MDFAAEDFDLDLDKERGNGNILEDVKNMQLCRKQTLEQDLFELEHKAMATEDFCKGVEPKINQIFEGEMSAERSKPTHRRRPSNRRTLQDDYIQTGQDMLFNKPADRAWGCNFSNAKDGMAIADLYDDDMKENDHRQPSSANDCEYWDSDEEEKDNVTRFFNQDVEDPDDYYDSASLQQIMEENKRLLDKWLKSNTLEMKKLPIGFQSCPWNPCWPKTRLYIERIRNSFAKKMMAVYQLYIGDFSCTRGTVVLYARRVVSVNSPHYVISTKKQDIFKDRRIRTDGYVGKVRGNKKTNEYAIYDNGCSSQEYDLTILAQDFWGNRYKGEGDGESDCEICLRKCVASVIFATNEEPNKNPMQVAIPLVSWPSASSVEWLDGDSADNTEPLLDTFRDIRARDMQSIELTDKMMCYHILEQNSKHSNTREFSKFQHKSTIPSVKNFQLVKIGNSINELNESDIVLQMNKVAKNGFSVDFCYPLSLMQAFSICLTRFDTKFS